MASDIMSYNVVQDHEGISRSQTARGPHLLRPFCVDNYEYRLTSLTLYIVYETSFLQVVRVSPAPGLL